MIPDFFSSIKYVAIVVTKIFNFHLSSMHPVINYKEMLIILIFKYCY